MTKISITILFAFLLLNISCNQLTREEAEKSSIDSLELKVTRYQDGSIKTKQQFLNDTIQHGYYKRYYKRGTPSIIIHYKLDKKDGTLKEFYPNGTLKLVENYDSGELVGLAKTYYSNGNLKDSCYLKHGNYHGPIYVFYRNGNIKEYVYTNENVPQTKLYEVSYDKDGNIEEEEGLGFPIIDYNYDTMGVKDTFKVDFYPINPPHAYKRILFVGEKNREGRFIDKKQVRLKDNNYTLKKSWNKPGVYWVGARLIIKSDNPNAKMEFNSGMYKAGTRVVVIDSSNQTK